VTGEDEIAVIDLKSLNRHRALFSGKRNCEETSPRLDRNRP